MMTGAWFLGCDVCCASRIPPLAGSRSSPDRENLGCVFSFKEGAGLSNRLVVLVVRHRRGDGAPRIRSRGHGGPGFSRSTPPLRSGVVPSMRRPDPSRSTWRPSASKQPTAPPCFHAHSDRRSLAGCSWEADPVDADAHPSREHRSCGRASSVARTKPPRPVAHFNALPEMVPMCIC